MTTKDCNGERIETCFDCPNTIYDYEDPPEFTVRRFTPRCKRTNRDIDSLLLMPDCCPLPEWE